MAKSSRSKWKKLHKRQRAKDVADTVQRRVERLSKKLELAAKGGLSAVPMQDPETRFHFVNPEMDMNVPHNCKGLNNNYDDLVRESLDFGRPLQLPPPRSSFSGKSDPNAPHPTTYQYEVVSAAAPTAGHAISIEDEKRMMEEEEQKEVHQRRLAEKHNKRNYNEEEEINTGEENEDDMMEEFVLGCNDAVRETSANTKAMLLEGRKAVAKRKSQKAELPKRISSMENTKRKNGVIQVIGDKKMKRMSDIPSSRLNSGGSVSKKKRVAVRQ